LNKITQQLLQSFISWHEDLTKFSYAKRPQTQWLIGRTKGGLNTKLQALWGNLGWPVRCHQAKGQRSVFKSGDALLKDWRRIATS
jgi:hypothetical protein